LSLQRPTSPRKSAAVAQRRAAAAQVFHFIARTTDGSPFGTFKVRTVTLDGQPWFVAPDVCRALGLCVDARTGTPLFQPDRFSTLRADEARLHPVQVNLRDGRVQNRRMWVVAESGLYKMTLRSDKAAAEPFRDWIAREVLPAIRKDGGYVDGEEKVRTGEMTEAP
jgi:prophage antirepressor-like protein